MRERSRGGSRRPRFLAMNRTTFIAPAVYTRFRRVSISVVRMPRDRATRPALQRRGTSIAKILRRVTRVTPALLLLESLITDDRSILFRSRRIDLARPRATRIARLHHRRDTYPRAAINRSAPAATTTTCVIRYSAQRPVHTVAA